MLPLIEYDEFGGIGRLHSKQVYSENILSRLLGFSTNQDLSLNHQAVVDYFNQDSHAFDFLPLSGFNSIGGSIDFIEYLETVTKEGASLNGISNRQSKFRPSLS